MTTAKEDEVTSSEEAATVDIRIESKGVCVCMVEMNEAISYQRTSVTSFFIYHRGVSKYTSGTAGHHFRFIGIHDAKLITPADRKYL